MALERGINWTGLTRKPDCTRWGTKNKMTNFTRSMAGETQFIFAFFGWLTEWDISTRHYTL